jgi:hypothetical protein
MTSFLPFATAYSPSTDNAMRKAVEIIVMENIPKVPVKAVLKKVALAFGHDERMQEVVREIIVEYVNRKAG